MTQKRKEQLANEMLGYICELVHSNEEIFNVLHGTLGMTREEMDAFGIDYLDEFFQSDVLYAKLMEKVERSYRALMSKWMDMFPDEIIERYDKVHAVCVAYRLLKKRAVTDAEVAWLFRFRDPEHPRAAVLKFGDSSGQEFYSVNVTVGIEDETYIEGGRCYPFAPLNEHNRKRKGKAGHE